MTYSVVDVTNKKPHNKTKMFLDGTVTIARSDDVKYPFLEKLTTKQLGFFWQPEEVEIARDAKDFRSLTPSEQHIFTANLKRQILLDSVQGRAPILAFGPVCSLPELETWLTTWTFSETIHSKSYTYLIKNVYPNPSEVFDTMMDIQDIVQCSHDITCFYDNLIGMSALYFHDSHEAYETSAHRYDLKKAIWMALMAVNILEGIRFYASFACSWAFAETKKMEGNAKIIKFICRDENLHLAGTQQILKALVTDDPDFKKIKGEMSLVCENLYNEAVVQEKAWAKYLFKDGSMIGLNEKLLNDFIEYTAHRRMVAVGLTSFYKVKNNPLPWTQKWISGEDVQVAPQETQITSYVVGGVKKDLEAGTFKGIKL
jgi:ribonucleoside-diphosphate reductase beta chain